MSGFRWVAGFDGEDFGLDIDHAESFGVSIESDDGSQTPAEGEFMLLRMSPDSGAVLEYGVGVLWPGLAGHVDTTGKLRRELTAATGQAVTVQVLSDSGSYSGEISLEGLRRPWTGSTAARWLLAAVPQRSSGQRIRFVFIAT